MAYTVKLGTFAKKENSTAQPDVTGWAEFTVTLKHGSSLIDPELTLSVLESDIVNYNYAYMLGSYYWIRSKVMERNNLCTISLEKDVLASYKQAIGASSLYILRSSAASDGNILDGYYPTTGQIYYGHSEDAAYNPAWAAYGLGQYIVNVLGTATTGNSTLWKLSPANFRSFINALYTQINGFQPTDVGDAVRKLIAGSGDKLITSAMWLPALNFTTAAAENIICGGWNTGVQGNLITDPIFSLSAIELNIPKHPQAATRGDYLNLAPYSTYTLTLPVFGSVNIDTTQIYNEDTLYINMKVDATNGQAKAIVSAGNGAIIANLTAQMGCPVPLKGQNNGESIVGGITSTLASVGAAIASGGAALPVIGAVSTGIGAAASALSGTSCSVGSSGGALALSVASQLNSVHLYITDEDNINNGRPLCIITTPATLGGYMMAQKAPLSISATLPELDKIRSYLTSGFYYE